MFYINQPAKIKKIFVRHKLKLAWKHKPQHRGWFFFFFFFFFQAWETVIGCLTTEIECLLYELSRKDRVAKTFDSVSLFTFEYIPGKTTSSIILDDVSPPFRAPWFFILQKILQGAEKEKNPTFEALFVSLFVCKEHSFTFEMALSLPSFVS